MNTVLILRGPSGVGKSTISALIQEKLGVNWTIIDVDKLKHYMPLKEGKVNRQERTIIAHSVSQFFAKQMYDKGYDIILEEMYRKEYNDNLLTFLKTNGMHYVKVFLYAPLEQVLERSKGREKVVPEEETRRLYSEVIPYEDDFVTDTSKFSSVDIANMVIELINDRPIPNKVRTK